MASAPEKTDWVCPEKEDRGGEECGGGGKSEKGRLRRQEGENQKDKDGEISGETEDSWQRPLRFCSHAARCQLLFGHKREKKQALSKESKHYLALKLVSFFKVTEK